MVTNAQKTAQEKYDKNNTRSVLFKFNLTNDADILSKLDEVGNKQGYIKELIRKDMRGEEGVLSLDSIKLLVQPVAKKYQIEKIYLFGSYARGEADAKSDIDMLIRTKKGGNLFAYYEIQKSFEKYLGKKVDLVENAAIERDDTRSGKRLRDHIERDKILIYESYIES